MIYNYIFGKKLAETPDSAEQIQFSFVMVAQLILDVKGCLVGDGRVTVE